MLLTDLAALYDRLIDLDRLQPPGYTTKPIRFLVYLDTTGHCLAIDDTAPQRTQRQAPSHPSKRTSAIKPTLAVDNVHYILGTPKHVGGEVQPGEGTSFEFASTVGVRSWAIPDRRANSPGP
jgi:hypothetical protein